MQRVIDNLVGLAGVEHVFLLHVVADHKFEVKNFAGFESCFIDGLPVDFLG